MGMERSANNGSNVENIYTLLPNLANFGTLSVTVQLGTHIALCYVKFGSRTKDNERSPEDDGRSEDKYRTNK